MIRRVGVLLCAVTLLGSACATKTYVQHQVTATETKLSATETKLNETEAKVEQLTKLQEANRRETTDLARASREADTVTDRQLKALDTRVDEVGALAKDAKTDSDTLAAVVDATEARLAHRIAGRNRYRVLETRSIYFDEGQAEIRTQDTSELEHVAKALKADPNAMSELQGFADPRGTDRANNDLSRARVEAVVRHLVQRHGIELRQLQAAAMGKATLAPGEKPTPDVLANARRVDIRLMAPWTSQEDQVQVDSPADAVSASPITTEVTPSPEPAQPAPERTEPVRPAPARTEPAQPAPERTSSGQVREILNKISKEELGGRD